MESINRDKRCFSRFNEIRLIVSNFEIQLIKTQDQFKVRKFFPLKQASIDPKRNVASPFQGYLHYLNTSRRQTLRQQVYEPTKRLQRDGATRGRSQPVEQLHLKVGHS